MNLTAEEIQQIETEMLKEVSLLCKEHHIDYYLAYGSLIGALRHQGPIPWDTDADIVIPINQIDKFISVARASLSDKFYLDYYDINNYYPTFFPRVGLKGYSSKILHLDVFKLVGLPQSKKRRKRFEQWSRFLAWLFEIKKMDKTYYGPFVHYKQAILSIKNILLAPIRPKWLINQFEKHATRYHYNDAEFVMNSVPGYAAREIIPKAIYGSPKLSNYGGFKVMIPENPDEYLRHFYGNYMEIPPESERQTKEFYEIDVI